MLRKDIVDPNVGNFVESLRDIGYSFEVAVADLIDNCITAKASTIKIHSVLKPTPVFCLLDDGEGMTELQLVEAMRLASKNPRDKREKNDLGRFGLGLKTASFSQCKKLTVISKRNNKVSIRQWDLEFISQKNKWYLLTPNSYSKIPLVDQLLKQKTGTLICWEDIDRLDKYDIAAAIDKLRKHLALVFHRYLEGVDKFKALKILINENPLIPFNPFNSNHPATQQIATEKIKIYGSTYSIQPYILPHHSKLSQQEYELYATEDGYIKSQGFYLYRENRILIYGTWWGMHKYLDAHKLVRIKIDIPNNMDVEWGIDIKKSIARPSEDIRKDLKRIISQITERGSRPYSGRGKKIEDKSVTHFWEIISKNEDFHFAINLDHPLFQDLKNELNKKVLDKLVFYLKAVQAFLPLDAIQYRMQKHPLQLKQQTTLTEEEIIVISRQLLKSGLTQQYIDDLLKTEIFINRTELLEHGN
jgi:hypothetical protein